MRVLGHNALAILVAAIAVYFVGFLFYGLIFAEVWVAATGWTEQELQSGMSKMPIGFIIPFMIAIGVSLAVKWRNKPGWWGGAETGLLMGFFLMSAVVLYGYVYSPAGGETILAIDALHQLATAGVAGAILGAWK